MFMPPFGENGGGPVSGERKEEKHPSGRTRVNLAPAVSLIQRLVTEDLCEEVFRDVRTKERRRKLSLHGLFFFWTSVVLRAPRALRLAFEQARVQADPFVPRLTAAMGSFFDRCQSLDYSFFLALYHRFVELVEKETRGGFGGCVGHLRDVFTTILIIDGSNCDKIAHRLKALRKCRRRSKSAQRRRSCFSSIIDRAFCSLSSLRGRRRTTFSADASVSLEGRGPQLPHS